MAASGASADDILRLRLRRQIIDRAAESTVYDPAHVVSRMCGMQAQDYLGALWSVALRSRPSTTASDVEDAIAGRLIIRTWPMRGTLHFVSPRDVRWMLALLGPRSMARATARHAQLGLSDATFERARAIFTEALSGGHALTRGEMMALLEADGIVTGEQRGYHILWMLAQRAVLCCGPVRGKQQTFVLLDEWVPSDEEPARDRAVDLARLARRYFVTRGPATIADFAWWAGITRTEARVGLEGAADGLRRLEAGDVEYWLPAEVDLERTAAPASIHLLPGFDEYALGYSDRTLQLGEHRETYGATVSANGMFSGTLVIGGRIAGTWKRTLRRDRVDIAVRAFRRLSAAERRGLTAAADRYGRFLGLPARVEV